MMAATVIAPPILIAIASGAVVTCLGPVATLGLAVAGVLAVMAAVDQYKGGERSLGSLVWGDEKNMGLFGEVIVGAKSLGKVLGLAAGSVTQIRGRRGSPEHVEEPQVG